MLSLALHYTDQQFFAGEAAFKVISDWQDLITEPRNDITVAS